MAMEIALLRKDFLDRPEVLALSCDYRVLLACCTVHPRREASGVLCFSPFAARLVGFDPAVAVEGLKVLDNLGLVIFDAETLEVLPADFFEVNDPNGASRFAKAGEGAAKRIRSDKVREAWLRLRTTAGTPVRSFAVRLNLISALAPRNGKIMISDAAIAIALVCNPLISAAGTGLLNIDGLAEMTAQTSAAAEQGVINVTKRGIVEVDEATGEYRVVNWLSMTGKLDYKNQQLDAIGAVLEIQSRRLKNAIKRDLERLLNTKFAELAKAFSLHSSTSCVLDFTRLNATSPHSTKPAPASPSPKAKSEEREDVFSEEEKAKAKARIQKSGWTKEEAEAALKTVLQEVTTREAAERAVATIATAEPGEGRGKISKPAAFWRSTANKAEAGTLPEPTPTRKAKHFDFDDAESAMDEACFNGMTIRQINAILAEERFRGMTLHQISNILTEEAKAAVMA